MRRLDGLDATRRYKIIGRILKPVLVQQGSKSSYKSLQVSLSSGGRAKSHRVANLVLLAFVGPPPLDKRCALHRDDCQTNNKLSNLRWGSQAQNGIDRKKNGRVCRGMENGNSKLIETEVKAILHELRTDRSHGRVRRASRKLALPYGAVWGVAKGLTWKRLER